MANGKTRHNIYERIFNFIVSVLKFIDKLPRTYPNQVIIGQITRSVTSMGANSEEADGTITRKDFLHCFTIVRKEGKETGYWLRLIGELNATKSAETEIIIQEGSEIVAIISTIIKNTLNSSKSQR
jgi:four helix bundle protein